MERPRNERKGRNETRKGKRAKGCRGEAKIDGWSEEGTDCPTRQGNCNCCTEYVRYLYVYVCIIHVICKYACQWGLWPIVYSHLNLRPVHDKTFCMQLACVEMTNAHYRLSAAGCHSTRSTRIDTTMVFCDTVMLPHNPSMEPANNTRCTFSGSALPRKPLKAKFPVRHELS